MASIRLWCCRSLFAAAAAAGSFPSPAGRSSSSSARAVSAPAAAPKTTRRLLLFDSAHNTLFVVVALSPAAPSPPLFSIARLRRYLSLSPSLCSVALAQAHLSRLALLTHSHPQQQDDDGGIVHTRAILQQHKQRSSAVLIACVTTQQQRMSIMRGYSSVVNGEMRHMRLLIHRLRFTTSPPRARVTFRGEGSSSPLPSPTDEASRLVDCKYERRRRRDTLVARAPSSGAFHSTSSVVVARVGSLL